MNLDRLLAPRSVAVVGASTRPGSYGNQAVENLVDAGFDGPVFGVHPRESSVLGVPCFTLRDNTERPVTIEQGSNTLVGADARGLPEAFARFRSDGGKRGRVPELWDGAAGTRVAHVLARFAETHPRA